MTHWRNIVRWLLLPVGVVATYILIAGINLLIFQEGHALPNENLALMIIKGLIRYVPAYLIAGMAAVYAGISIAPSNKKAVAIVLGTIIAVILIAAVAIDIYGYDIGKIDKGSFLRTLFQNIGGLIGSVGSAYMLVKSGDYD